MEFGDIEYGEVYKVNNTKNVFHGERVLVNEISSLRIGISNPENSLENTFVSSKDLVPRESYVPFGGHYKTFKIGDKVKTKVDTSIGTKGLTGFVVHQHDENIYDVYFDLIGTHLIHYTQIDEVETRGEYFMSELLYGYPHVYTIVNRISDWGDDVIVVDTRKMGDSKEYLCEMVNDRTDSLWVSEKDLKHKGVKGLDCYFEDEDDTEQSEEHSEPEPVAIIDLETQEHFYYTDDVLMRMHEKGRDFYVIGSDGSLLDSVIGISFEKIK